MISALALAVATQAVFVPANPDMTPEARQLVEWLLTERDRTLSGVSSYGRWESIVHAGGRAPAVFGEDVYGWNTPKWAPLFRSTLENQIDEALFWHEHKGGIVTLHWHWGRPDQIDGTAWVRDHRDDPPYDLAEAVKQGTPEHEALMTDLSNTADYLVRLSDANVPVLWRPLHEIDGGWFWWTDTQTPENTAELWRVLYRYLVDERGLDNLIWVYNAGVRAGGEFDRSSWDAEVAWRKRFYPGDAFVDLSSIDIYRTEHYGSPREDTFQRAFDLMEEVTPGKALALGESAMLPNPAMLADDGPDWVWALPWFKAGPQHDPAWIRETYASEAYLSLDELPTFGREVAPHVWIESPQDGMALEGRVRLVGQAGDRNGDLEKVMLFEMPDPWLNWEQIGEEEVLETLMDLEPIGGVNGARPRFEVEVDRPTAFAMVAMDSRGVVSSSNVVRLAGRNVVSEAEVIGSVDGVEAALDGEPLTRWEVGRDAESWIEMRFDEVRDIEAVYLSWWKPRPVSVVVSVPMGTLWGSIGEVEDALDWKGGMTTIEFDDPLRTDRLRLDFSGHREGWGGHSLQELIVRTR